MLLTHFNFGLNSEFLGKKKKSLNYLTKSKQAARCDNFFVAKKRVELETT